MINEMEKNLQKLELDVIAEIDKRIRVVLATKSILKYDIKRKYYTDETMNPFDFVKLFCAGTYKMETKEISMKEESNSESVCNKCDKSEANNIKLLKNVESLTLEIQILKDEKQSDVE
ncbi:hypothetical protein Hanom_Chr10g00885251 [Helianthus anomalus]